MNKTLVAISRKDLKVPIFILVTSFVVGIMASLLILIKAESSLFINPIVLFMFSGFIVYVLFRFFLRLRSKKYVFDFEEDRVIITEKDHKLEIKYSNIQVFKIMNNTDYAKILIKTERDKFLYHVGLVHLPKLSNMKEYDDYKDVYFDKEIFLSDELECLKSIFEGEFVLSDRRDLIVSEMEWLAKKS